MMSPREMLQLEIVGRLPTSKFTAPYGIISGKADNQKYRTIAFGIARTLDAEIRIYGPRFILLKWTTSIRRMPPMGTEKFDDADQLIRFITNNFI